MELRIIQPRSATALILRRGQQLKIIDIEGQQVCDLMCYNLDDKKEYLSSGRTIDYAETIFLTTGHLFYSNRINPMFEIIDDSVKRHDFLLTPCSIEMFRGAYNETDPHPGCHDNLCSVLRDHGISADEIPVTFNIFMNVEVDLPTGKLSIMPPLSKAGDYILIEAKMDLVLGLTSCSDAPTNNHQFKPIAYHII